MELPFSYVVFFLMNILNLRNKKMKINKGNLLAVFKNLIELMPYDEEEKNEYKDNFDFYYELEEFISEYNDYVDIVNNDIILNIDDDIFEEILTLSGESYDEDLIDDINVTIEDNYVFLDLLGIKIRKDIHKIMVDNEEEIERMYEDNKNVDIRKLNYLTAKRKFLFLYVENHLSIDEYYDLFIYSINVARNNDECGLLDFKIDDEDFDGYELLENPFHRTLFYSDALSLYTFSRTIDHNISKMVDSHNLKNKSEKLFYITFLKFLNEEIDNINDNQLKHEMKLSKNKLIYVLDAIHDTCIFNGVSTHQNNYEENINEDYSFIENMVFYFIDEILLYDDNSYKYDDKDFYNMMNYYFNIIKMLYIKTYYYLTKDEKVIASIKDNPLYKVNKISSDILDSAIGGDKVKIRKRRTS